MLGTSMPSQRAWRSLTTVRNPLIRPLPQHPRLMTGRRMWNASHPRFRPYHRRVLARFLGVSIAATLVYTWYQSSYIKKAVDAAHTAKTHLDQTLRSLPDHQTKAVETFSSLLQEAKTSLAVLPNADVVVDRVFSSVKDVVDSHAEEANIIAAQASQEIQDIVQRGDKGPVAGTLKILGVLKRCAGQLLALKAQSRSAENLPKLDEKKDDIVIPTRQHQKVEEVWQEVQSITGNLPPGSKDSTSSDDTPSPSVKTGTEDDDSPSQPS